MAQLGPSLLAGVSPPCLVNKTKLLSIIFLKASLIDYNCFTMEKKIHDFFLNFHFSFFKIWHIFLGLANLIFHEGFFKSFIIYYSSTTYYYSGHYVVPAMPKGSARTPLRPIKIIRQNMFKSDSACIVPPSDKSPTLR